MVVVLLSASATLFTSACGSRASTSKALTAEEQFAQAQKLFNKKKYFESAEEFQKVIYNYPGANIIDTAQYFLANSYLEDEQFELAAVEFERLIKNYPRSDFAPDSRFLTGYARYRAAPRHYGLDQSELLEAIRIMEDFVIDYPDSRLIPEANKALNEAHTRLAQKVFKSGMVYVHIRAFESALIYFQKVLDEYSDTEYAPLALLEMGKVQFKMQKLAKAAATFNTFLAQYPEHKRVKEARQQLDKVEKKLAEQAPVSTSRSAGPASDSLALPQSGTSDSSIDSEIR